MPSEKLVPYRFEMYEKGDSDKGYDLTELKKHDKSFKDNNIIEIIRKFCASKSGSNLEPSQNDKTFVIEDFHKHSDNVIEGIISSGYHGYEAPIRDVNSGQLAHLKQQDEAEQMPLYFLFYRPDTTAGEPYDSGETMFAILHQVNRIGIKTKLSKHLGQFCLSGVSETTMNMNPVYTEDVVEKVLDADRIPQIDLDIRKIPNDDDEKGHELVKGMDTQEVDSRSIVLRPERGGTFKWIKQKAQQVKDSDNGFGELVSDNVEDMTITTSDGEGHTERFSLLSDEIPMRRDLDSDVLSTSGGLITADALRSQTNDFMNNITPDNIVEDLTGTASVNR